MVYDGLSTSSVATVAVTGADGGTDPMPIMTLVADTWVNKSRPGRSYDGSMSMRVLDAAADNRL